MTDNIITTDEVTMVTDLKKIDDGLFVREDPGWQSDKLLDNRRLAGGQANCTYYLGSSPKVTSLLHTKNLPH